MKKNKNLISVFAFWLAVCLLAGCHQTPAAPPTLPSAAAVVAETATDLSIPPINHTDLYSYEGEKPKSLYDYYCENEDTIGWLTIAGIDTDNIVMLGQKYKEYEKGSMGKNHYLDYDFYHNRRTAGELYIDHRGQIGYNGTSQNLTVYGHHMINGTMLAGIERYRNQSHQEQYPYFTFHSLWNTYHYKVFGVFVVDQKNPIDRAFDFRQPDYETQQVFMDMIDEIRRRSLYDINVDVCGTDRIMNLITCTYPTGNPATDNARLVVMGRLCTDPAEIAQAEALLAQKAES